MKSANVARSLLFLLITAGFAFLVWQLLQSAPETGKERPRAPAPMVDIIDSVPADYPVSAQAAGPVVSAYELEIRPQVSGRITALHSEFEPGGRIPAGNTIVEIDAADFRLARAAAEAEVAKARATITLEQGRRVVAREELADLGGSLKIDPKSQALALRKPQLRQVQAELAAAQNRLKQAELDLTRTKVSLPFDVIVLERTRVSGEVVAERELIGRVTRADSYWVELRTQPTLLTRLHVRNDGEAGSRVTIRHGVQTIDGEVVRIRADVAAGSRLAGVIAAIPVDPASPSRFLLGSYVEADIDAGVLNGVVRAPRRALRDNDRIWVADAQNGLQVREAHVLWESSQDIFLSDETLRDGDRIVVSRITGLVPGTNVRVRHIDDSGSPVSDIAVANDNE